jgi:YD repeat-containing protein
MFRAFAGLIVCAGIAAAQSYEYDAVGRLIRVLYAAGGGIAYEYDASSNITAVMSLSVPAAPSGVAVTRISPTETSVNWQASPGASGYVIERRRADSDVWEEVTRVSGDSTTFTDPNVEAGVEYVYRVAALGADGRSAYSDEASFAEEPNLTKVLISAGGAVALTTLGESAEAQAGYATVSVNSGDTPYGVAVFSTSVNDIVVSEAGVPSSPPTTHARIFIDFRNNVALATPQSTGTISITTGIGVANPGGGTAAIQYTLRNGAGDSLAVGNGTLASGKHFAVVINDMQSVAPDFLLPADFATNIRFGSLDIQSNEPISIMALRGSINQRGELLLTSTPVADLQTPPASEPVFFPTWPIAAVLRLCFFC